MTKNKARFVFVLMVMGFTLGGMLLDPAENTLADANQLGPYTEIQLSLEDLPALNKDLVFQPVIDVETETIIHDIEGIIVPEQIGVNLQVLYVLEDPREVPLARYASNTESGVVLPDGDLINQDNLKTINVFVRLEATHKTGPDPVLASDSIDLQWPSLYVVPLSYEMVGVPRFRCAPVEYADGTQPYQLPAGIDGGDAMGGDGLYDPAAYAPPKPWYYSDNPQLEEGEVREGWISCLAPDIPLEQIQIKFRHTFIPEPEIVYTDEDQLKYEPFPEISELELIGLTHEDIPKTIRECRELDYCFNEADEFLCEYQAQEAGKEQGLCVIGMLETTDSEGNVLTQSTNVTNPEAEVIQARVFFTKEYKEPIQQSYLLWNYTVNRSYPVSLIRLDDILLTFIDEYGNLLKDRGSVVFYDPILDYSATGAYISELDSQVDHEYENEILDGDDYALFSRVVVEPDNLSREDVEDYQLSEIGVILDTLVDHEGVRLFARNSNLEINKDFVQPSDPFEGIIYSGIGSKSVDKELEEEFRHQRPKGYGSLHTGSALIGIRPMPEDLLTSVGPVRSYHPISVITMFKPSLDVETTMCDVVDCVDITIPRYENNPPRTVPVMCAGEWANNFIIDSGDLVPVMYYIGEAWGTGKYSLDNIHRDFEGWENQRKILLYDGRVMGGAAPWWLYTRTIEDLSGRIIGRIVDLEKGTTLDNEAYITHYYERVDKNDLSQGYFAPADWRPLSSKGWIVGIAEEKVLIFGTITPYDDERFEVLNDSNTGFLFHEEGPIWVTECQRQTISTLADPVSYTQPNNDRALPLEGGEHWIKELLDEMDYPPALPVIREEVIPLGEYTDPFSRDGNYRVAAKNIRIVSGKPNVPIVYIASEDKFYPAEKNPNFNNEVFFQRSGAVVIPPDTSYIRVRISIDYIDTGERFTKNCSLEQESFQLVYPGYLPITGISDRVPDLMYPCDNKDYSTWIHFFLPSLDLDPDTLLLSVRTNGKDPWFFLKLTE